MTLTNDEPKIRGFLGPWSFLSNFYPVGPFKWQTMEHFFQAMKTLEEDERDLIAMAATPGIAKRLGRNVQLRPDWEGIKLSVMEFGLREKFKPYSDMSLKLSSTYRHPLVEYNDWGDTYWGVCRGYGDNHLGKLLMKIRRDLITYE